MKQIYTLLLMLMLTVGARAAELTFYLGDAVITNGETVYYKDYEEKAQGKKNTQITYAPPLYIMSDVAASNVDITVESLTGQDVTFCLGSNCQSGTNLSITGGVLRANEKCSLMFDYIGLFPNDAIEYPSIDVKITAMYHLNKNSKREFIIKLGPNNAVTVTETTQAISCNGRTLEYLVPGTTTVTLFDATGRQRAAHTVSGSGSIDLATLPSGLYIYRAKGATQLTGKIIVR